MLRRPETYLAALMILVVLFVADTFRSPERQISGQLYIGLVRGYQIVGRPLFKGWIACRYIPTCSEYSIQAVQKHGFRHGSVLTYMRINSCRASVADGTYCPIPPLAGE
jgi:putative membrane protein insertion efficiency factor